MRAMTWSLAVCALAAVPAAYADGQPPPVPQRIDCYVYNNTDHEIGLYDGLRVGYGRPSLGTQTLTDGTQKLEISCTTPDEHLKLIGTRGAVTIERLPSWFQAHGVDGELRITATKKGAVVELDGKPVKLVKGVANQPIDARAKLLAGDPDAMFDPKPYRRSWSILTEVKATAGTETVTLIVAVELNSAVRTVIEDLHRADKAPVVWAVSTDHAGPAIVFGCARLAYRVRDYDIVRSPRALTELSLVAICEPARVKIDTCPTSKDKFAADEPLIDRDRIDAKVTLVEAKTSKVVASTTLRGGEPAKCRDSAAETIVGDVPSKGAILDWMNTVK